MILHLEKKFKPAAPSLLYFMGALKETALIKILYWPHGVIIRSLLMSTYLFLIAIEFRYNFNWFYKIAVGLRWQNRSK